MRTATDGIAGLAAKAPLSPVGIARTSAPETGDRRSPDCVARQDNEDEGPDPDRRELLLGCWLEAGDTGAQQDGDDADKIAKAAADRMLVDLCTEPAP